MRSSNSSCLKFPRVSYIAGLYNKSSADKQTELDSTLFGVWCAVGQQHSSTANIAVVSIFGCLGRMKVKSTIVLTLFPNSYIRFSPSSEVCLSISQCDIESLSLSVPIETKQALYRIICFLFFWCDSDSMAGAGAGAGRLL